MTFDNRYVSIWTHSPGNYRIVIRNKPRIARELNAVLKHYSDNTVFVPEDEPCFPFVQGQIEYIKQGSRYLGKILAQLEKAS